MKHIKDVKSFEEYIENLEFVGFQATNIATGAEILKGMWSDNATVYLSFTGNIIATGMRGLIAKLVEEKLVDVVVTTAGAVDHDVIKSIGSYELGSFSSNDAKLHQQGRNRIGNVLVPNERYEEFERVCMEVFSRNIKTSPSELSEEFGRWIEENSEYKEGSFLYWAYKNKVPVFVPGITDGAVGLQAFFFKQQTPEFSIDVTKDMKKLADITLNAELTGALILGGGISKHHTIGVNIARGGLDYAVYVSTATEFDGSLSGAKSNEAISWGKIKEEARHIDIFGEVSVVLPLLLKKAGVI